MSLYDQLQQTKPFGHYTPEKRADQIRHLTEDTWLYEPGKPRFICSILGVLYDELREGCPDLAELVLEATWMARRMHDHGKAQQHLDWGD